MPHADASRKLRTPGFPTSLSEPHPPTMAKYPGAMHHHSPSPRACVQVFAYWYVVPPPKSPGGGREMEGHVSILSLLQGFTGERPTHLTGRDMLTPHPHTSAHKPS